MELAGFARVLLYSALVAGLCRGQNDWMQCSAPCKCKWVSGKKTAECVRQNMTSVPTGLSSLIQNLELTGNRIRHLHRNAFCSVNLENLHKLVLRESRIETVDPGAFNRLKIIIEIDLSGNDIRALHPDTFVETERLRVLLLGQNKLKVLENGLFRDLKFLQKVTLSDNRLERIGERVFRNLSEFQVLALDGNNLSTLRPETFEDLPKLGSLELRDNPWNCNCSLKEFRDWIMLRKLYTRGTDCRQPAHLSERMWADVDSEEFACRPVIFATGPPGARGGNVDGGDVVLSCKATGVPRPQISWLYRSRVLNNQARRPFGDRGYILSADSDWLNLTIPDVTGSDKGDYVCQAKNPGGEVEQSVTVTTRGEAASGRDSAISLPLAVGLGATAVLLMVVTMTLCACYCRRRRTRQDEKSVEAASHERHGLADQEKSLITAINPVVKPPRRYEAPSVTSHGTEMTELNRTLLDNDSVFADGVGSGGIGVGSVGTTGARGEEDREESGGGVGGGGGGGGGDLDRNGILGMGGRIGGGGSIVGIGGTGTLTRSTPSGYRQQYPPDLLAFPGGRGASPTSQASTVPDNSRLGSQPQSPTASHYPPANFKTLPHSRSVTPYLPVQPAAPVMPRHGYVTIPRRPRAPSWSSGPPPTSPTSPTSANLSMDALEPLYDNLGQRVTADGSWAFSLNKSPEPPASSTRSRPWPGTPTSLYGTIQRSTPNILASSPIERGAPEGAPEYPGKPLVEPPPPPLPPTTPSPPPIPSGTNSLGRKVPPRPPPKPKKRSTNGPLYEDEGEDGTEV